VRVSRRWRIDRALFALAGMARSIHIDNIALSRVHAVFDFQPQFNNIVVL